MQGCQLYRILYLTVQYRIFTLVPCVPYGTENVPYFGHDIIYSLRNSFNLVIFSPEFSQAFPSKLNILPIQFYLIQITCDFCDCLIYFLSHVNFPFIFSLQNVPFWKAKIPYFLTFVPGKDDRMLAGLQTIIHK